ncbi:hypothetical protein LZ30DRAFT_664653 [Colletotrichum cereale]|nr:hypothetical protein LZ30DRAFT_664653 [Colletotrichum cereale]
MQTFDECNHANRYCRVMGLVRCLQVASDEENLQEMRLDHAERLRRAITREPRFVIFQICCCNDSLLSLAVKQTCPKEALEFLLTNVRFQQENGCRITDFVEHLGYVIACLMAGYRARTFDKGRLDDGKRSLGLLLRAGIQNSFVRRVWYGSGLHLTWLLGIFQAASTYEYVALNSSTPGQAYESYATPVFALLDFAECVIEMFRDEESPSQIKDGSFWTAILESLWTHPRVTKGTLTRVVDVTVQLVDLGASKHISLPKGVKGGSFLACIESGLNPLDFVVDPYVDDITTMIECDNVMHLGDDGQFLFVNTLLLWEMRKVNIERLKDHVLACENSPYEDLQAATDPSLEGN